MPRYSGVASLHAKSAWGELNLSIISTSFLVINKSNTDSSKLLILLGPVQLPRPLSSCPGPRPAVLDHVLRVYARDLNCQ